ncbi:hypothetical protein [Microbacterium murale]|uniref:Uncharacterized protein n=1 Tax=Microbacterium murale TaxID=1081040 RepID=A0ABU0P9R5_9MICO|nr:hypothetical protein [Microbacterium murale]MDQ0644063.1 hypothetical protein [Microbacterium murale]
MRSSLPWRRGAAAVLALVLPVASAMLAAQAEEEDEGPPPDGAVMIPYQEAGEIRPGEGWLIDCAALGVVEGVTITCDAESITLSAAYDPDWGEHPLSVRMVSKHTDLQVGYALRMEPPPAPEITMDRLDMPIEVGEQAMLPLSALGIECEMCSDDGGAIIEVGKLPHGVDAGVSATHLSVRGSVVGDAEIPLRVTDDAGQTGDVKLTVSFVKAAALATADASADEEQPVGALHVVSSASEWDLAALSWGEDRTIVCAEPRPAGLTCAPDGRRGARRRQPAALAVHVPRGHRRRIAVLGQRDDR